MRVIKADGSIENFRPEKILHTLRRSGLSEADAKRVLDQVTKTLYDGISTKEILNRVKTVLRREQLRAAMRYDLKGAIIRLGPTGYPFENFVARILEYYGYWTKLRTMVEGELLNHEIDIIAEKVAGRKIRCMVECKFHNSPGGVVDVKDVLYTYARFLDINEGGAKGKGARFDEVWLVSNTRVSTEAIKYANGKGMRLLCWRCGGGVCPFGMSLEKVIESKGLYPVTILRSCDRETFEKLFRTNVILARELLSCDLNQLRRKTQLKEEKIRRLASEAKQLFL
jgi:hypothetical protein